MPSGDHRERDDIAVGRNGDTRQRVGVVQEARLGPDSVGRRARGRSRRAVSQRSCLSRNCQRLHQRRSGARPGEQFRHRPAAHPIVDRQTGAVDEAHRPRLIAKHLRQNPRGALGRRGAGGALSAVADLLEHHLRRGVVGMGQHPSHDPRHRHRRQSSERGAPRGFRRLCGPGIPTDHHAPRLQEIVEQRRRGASRVAGTHVAAPAAAVRVVAVVDHQRGQGPRQVRACEGGLPDPLARQVLRHIVAFGVGVARLVAHDGPVHHPYAVGPQTGHHRVRQIGDVGVRPRPGEGVGVGPGGQGRVASANEVQIAVENAALHARQGVRAHRDLRGVRRVGPHQLECDRRGRDLQDGGRNEALASVGVVHQLIVEVQRQADALRSVRARDRRGELPDQAVTPALRVVLLGRSLRRIYGRPDRDGQHDGRHKSP